MKILMALIFLIMIICFLLILLINFFSKKTFSDREKNSPFECGFDPKTSARLPFSMQFFMLTLIFLIFDVELTLILPMILMVKFTNLASYSLTLIFFILILILGLIHEWSQKSLEWKL